MKFTRPVFLATLSVASMLIAPLSAQAEEQTPIIVTATRTAQTADETIAPVIVIDRSEIENNPGAEVSDLLRMHAGIDIGRNGGPGQTTSIFIRGTESNHTLVMIDGIKINPGTIGTAAIQNIRLDMIERIEIVKGPRSTLYGSDAIGGVINIITRRGKEGSHYQVNASHGSYKTTSLGFSADNKVDDRAAGINVNIEKSKGYAIRTTSPIERGYDNVNINLYGKKRMGETNLEITHWQSTGKTEYLDFFLTAVDQNYENSATALNIENNYTANWLSKIKLSRINDRIDQNQGVDYAHTQRDVLDWQNDIQLGNSQLVTAGIYFSNENTNASVYGSNFDENTDVKAIFAQDDATFGQHHVIAGIRSTHHKTYGTYNTWNIDYAWQVNDSTRFILGSATGFRSPDSTDRFGGATGNPNLLPEESKNNELGIQYVINKQQNVRVNYFQNDITNLIEYDFATSKMQNIAAARIKGTEIEYKFESENWSVDASAIFQDPENQSDGSQLSRRTKTSYTAGINHMINKHSIGIDVLYAGERDNSAYDTVILKSYTLANLKAHFQASKHLSINARIENLTDEVYELASTYRTPARSYYAELVYNFD